MLEAEVQNVFKSSIEEKKVMSWAQKSHETVSNKKQAVVIRIVDNKEAQELNVAYRDKDYPTNVLSFVYDDTGLEATGYEEIEYLGDIVICDPVIQIEAKEQNKSYESHFAHMIVHGVLHLNGYDHEEAVKAEKMEKLEVEILAKLGFQNPYN